MSFFVTLSSCLRNDSGPSFQLVNPLLMKAWSFVTDHSLPALSALIQIEQNAASSVSE